MPCARLSRGRLRDDLADVFGQLSRVSRVGEGGDSGLGDDLADVLAQLHLRLRQHRVLVLHLRTTAKSLDFETAFVLHLRTTAKSLDFETAYSRPRAAPAHDNEKSRFRDGLFASSCCI